MGRARFQEIQSDILKNKYETLLKLNFEEFSDNELFSWVEDSISPIFTKKKSPKKLDTWLYKDNLRKKLEENKRKSIDYLQIFIDVFDYEDELVQITELINENGILAFNLPIRSYPKLYQTLSENNSFHINSVFGISDERENVHREDINHIHPVWCKYLLVVITRKKTEKVLLNTEFRQDISELETKHFQSIFNNSAKKTRKDLIYKKLIAEYENLYLNIEDISNIESLYINSDINASRSEYRDFRKVKLKQIAQVTETESSQIFALLNSFDESGYNSDKFKEKIEFLSKDDGKRDVKETADLIFKLIKLEREEVDFIPNKDFLEDIKNIVLVKKHKYEFAFNQFIVLRPHEWAYGELEMWQKQSDEIDYLIVFLDEDTTSDYLIFFLNSHLGKLSQEKVLIESNHDINSFGNIEIPLPTIDEQSEIVGSIDSANKLLGEIHNLNEMLLSSPSKANEINSSLKDWLSRLDKLSIDEKIKNLAKIGETDKIEFKSSFSYDIKQDLPNQAKNIEHSVHKTIAGFLNSKGGELLVGVRDDGEILGVDKEIEKWNKNSSDAFLLYFLNKLKKPDLFGSFLDQIRYEIVNVDSKNVLYVKCTKSKTPCFIKNNGKDAFYVRKNPGTIELLGRELHQYTQSHKEFNNNE